MNYKIEENGFCINDMKEEESILKDNERIDCTGFGNVKVIQTEGMGYGVDAVLLAAFAAGETGAKAVSPAAGVIDLGSGSGIIGMILAHKFPDLTVLGVDKRDDSVDRAARAASLSGLADRVSFECAEIKGYGAPGNPLGAPGNPPGAPAVGSAARFDAVVTNPPYFRRNAAIPSASDGKFIARHETTAVLADFIAASDRMLERGGDLYMVHRPDRLADIIYEMRSQRIEPKELQLVAPRVGEPANIVLIHGVKCAGAELKVLPEIAVHTADGGYTDIINRIYER